MTGNKSVYKVFPKTQEVVHWYPGFSGSLMKYTKCAIASVGNWQCTYNDGSGSFGYSNGKYWEYPVSEEIAHVSKWRWWYINLLQKDMPHYLKLLLD